MRIDTHVHVWDLTARPVEWIAGDALRPLERSFSLADLHPAAASADITDVVLVQAVPVLDETRDLLQLALDEDLVCAVVGWLDLESETVEPDLESYLAHPGGGRLVGIRDMAQDKPDPHWLARPDVIRNIRALGSHGLAYDLLTLAVQLPAATQAVRECPEVQFVLDHLSKPPIASGQTDPWADDVRRLAQFPNVVCKVSGLVTQAQWKNWTFAEFEPYFEVVLDAFGPTRLMFGSDWPVSLLSAEYEQVVAVATMLAATLSASEQERFWSGTAKAAYGLDR
jgi:L-fuconolactonase